MQIDFELLLVLVNGGLLVLSLLVGMFLVYWGTQFPLHLGDQEMQRPMARKIYVSLVLLLVFGLTAAVFNLVAELL